MNRRDFAAVRDAIALASMLQRGEDLWPVRADLWQQYQGLRAMLADATDRNMIDGLQFELYDHERGIAWAWAKIDAEIETIMRDSRYQAWAKSQLLEAS